MRRLLLPVALAIGIGWCLPVVAGDPDEAPDREALARVTYLIDMLVLKAPVVAACARYRPMPPWRWISSQTVPGDRPR